MSRQVKAAAGAVEAVERPPSLERASARVTPTHDERPLIVIRPSKRWVPLNLRALWEYRELLYFLVWRDIKVRYKQTALGASWALIQPFMMMVVFSIFLGRLADVPSDGKPYPLFVFAGLVPWMFFSQSLSGTSMSLVGNSHLVSKVYFPRIVLPIAAAGSFVVDLVLALGLLGAIMAYYGEAPSVWIVTLPLLTVLALMTALAVGTWLAALNVRYRDIRYTVPFLTQLWLFLSPVAYPASLVPEQWRFLYGLNPMAGVVEGFRWAIIGTESPPVSMLVVSTLGAALMLLGGLVYFRKVERTFADVI